MVSCREASRAIMAVAIVLSVGATASRASLLITYGPTAHVKCKNGVCTATAKDAILNADDLTNLLHSGDVTVSAGSKAGSIELDNIVSVNTTHLTLDAQTSLTFRAPLVVYSSEASLTLTTNDGGTGGTVSFGDDGYVWFWDTASALTIDSHPYTLVKDLTSLASAAASNPAGYYALSASYDATSDGVLKVPVVAKPFKGVFNGLGNSISNLRIKSKKSNQDLGLFSTSSGAIVDLKLSHASVAGSDNSRVGTVVGTNTGLLYGDVVDGTMSDISKGGSQGRFGLVAGTNAGTVSHSTSSGTAVIGCYCYIGGLVGDHHAGTIDSSHSSVDVSGTTYPGGLVGLASGNISNSYATGAVHAPQGAAPFAGGLASGADNTATITDSYATGTVTTGEFGIAGGLIGSSRAIVERCYATGNASDGHSGGDAYVGGLVAYNSGNIVDSYAMGSLQEYSGEIGGLAGHNAGTIATSYSIGLVSSMSVPFGGFIGVDQSETTTSGYWDLDTSGVADPAQGAGSPQNDPGVTGLTTKQLTANLPQGFDPAVWGQSKLVNNGFPYLRTIPPKH